MKPLRSIQDRNQPAGVRKPKQKASVEGTVGKIATAIIAKLRNKVFFSFEDLKGAVARKLYEFNHERFQKREGTRYDAYLDEKESLHALPESPYEIATWVYGRKVNIDYHVVFEYNRYSCPYQYARKTVDLKVTDSTVEIYSGSVRRPIIVSLTRGKTSILPTQKICRISSGSPHGTIFVLKTGQDQSADILEKLLTVSLKA